MSCALLAGCTVGQSVVGGEVQDAGAEDVVNDLGDVVGDAPKDVAVDTGADVPMGPCRSNSDCARSTAGPVCDTVAGVCVECLVRDDRCAPAQHCDPDSRRCVAGCRADEGCATSAGGDAGAADAATAALHCETTSHTCVACVTDDHCPSGNVCRGHVCVPGCLNDAMCPTGQRCCTGGCVDTRTNTDHCNGCGMRCSAANGSATCTAGVCGVGRCNEGFSNCDEDPSNGCETYVSGDVSNCGACHNACAALPNGGPTCRGGRCLLGVCAGGFGSCDNDDVNGCEVDIRTSPLHCGACGNNCVAPANAVPTCAASMCGFQCLPGFADCDRNAANGCETDTRSDTMNCGMCGSACAAPAHGAAGCAMGACTVVRCDENFADCNMLAGDGCEVDLRVNASHCGTCTTACPSGQVCAAGRCEVPCPMGQTRCAGACVNTDNDPANCGMCGNACGALALCGGGSCVMSCGAGQTNCSGSCASLMTDPLNCGMCGNRCAAGNSCQSGTCRLICPAGQNPCGTECVNTGSDNRHCGVCGNACVGPETCVSGRCQLVCATGQIACAGACVDPQRDAQNCGACGMVCETGCFSGACARVQDVDAGFWNNCAVFTSGRLLCWGLNGGVLTRSGGAWGHRAAPVQVTDGIGRPVEGVLQVATGTDRACALLRDRSVVCWGNGVDVGVVTGLTNIAQLHARSNIFAAVTTDGRVFTWDGRPRTPTDTALVAVAGITDAVEVAAGASSTCARNAAGTVRCWGAGTLGQLGQGASTTSTTPVTVMNLTDATQITSGASFTCALRRTGAVMCWGLNADGQLGDGTTTNRNAPVTVTGLTGVSLVRAGLRHVCAVTTTGAVRCWGDNASSQLGDGTLIDRSTPVAVSGIPAQRQVTAHDHHTCAVANDNVVRCWGGNNYGEGAGGTEARPTPALVMGLDNVVDLRAGYPSNPAFGAGRVFRCALRSDGSVWCWGTTASGNESGQLGDGTTTQRATPAPVMGLTDATQITVGSNHVCALKRDATVVCWGRNAEGQLGDGTTTARTRPTPVPGLTSVAEVRAGALSTCARRSDGAVFCWGPNTYGELGNGSRLQSNTPFEVTLPHSAVQLESGAYHYCARMMDTTVQCWGRNIETQLADLSTTNRYVPGGVLSTTATISTPTVQTGFTRIECDLNSCWGQLAAGTNVGWGSSFGSRTTAATSLNGLVQFSQWWNNVGSSGNVCYLRDAGALTCQGINEYGNVGDGTVSFAVNNASSITGAWTQVRRSYAYSGTCAVRAQQVWCWGWTGDGALLAAGIDGFNRSPAVITPP